MSWSGARIRKVERAGHLADAAQGDSPCGLHAWGEASMRRRDLLKTAAAATLTASVSPRLGRGEDRAKTLVFVGVADLSILDPVVTGARPTRNSAYLVFDTLYGIDTEWKAQSQMVAGQTVEEDGLTWTLKLRDGLRFHDNEPVLARDVVASIRRFAPRVIFANALMNETDELSAPDDSTVRFRLKRPFPHLPEALAGPGGNVPAIMPERLAAESPFKPVAEVVGSGPYRFLKDEHVSGARAVFQRFAEYQPRAGGSVGFTAGPKVAHFERVEWLTLDPFSASAALRRGEIDWWENPARDLVGQVNGDPNITRVNAVAVQLRELVAAAADDDSDADLANEQFSAALEEGKTAVETGRIDPEQAEVALNELEQKLST